MTTQIPMISELYEGRGVNPDTFRAFSVGINFEPLASLINPQGQTCSLTIQTVANTSELASSLNVSASIVLTTMRGGGSAEARFFQQKKLNTYYTYGLVKIYVENPAKLIRNVTLKESAIKRLKEGGWDEFSQIYGSQYVEGFVTGGIYYALIEIQTTNAEEKREISAKLSGKYNGFGVKIEGSGEAVNKLQEATNNQTTNIYVFQSAGSGDVLETTLEEMIKQAVEFPKLVKEAPVPIRAILNDYKSIENAPSIPLVPSKQRTILERLGTLYMKLKDYEVKLDFVSNNIDIFDEYKNLNQSEKRQKRRELNTHRDKVLDEMQLIADSADECINNYKECKIPQLSDNLFDSVTLPEDDSMITQQILSGSSLKEFSEAHSFRNSTGNRVDTNHITFPKGKFRTPPNVVVSLKQIDVDKNKGIRVDVFPLSNSITTDGFDLAYRTWSDSVVYAIDATWVAYGS